MNKQPEYLYLLRPTRMDMLRDGPEPREAAAIAGHFAYLRQLLAEKTLVLAGRTRTNDEKTFGMVVFRAADDAAAQAIVDADPAVAGEVMSAELFPYQIALLSPDVHGG